MLNKILLAYSMLISLNSFAADTPIIFQNNDIELKPVAAYIKEPFTALAIADFKIVNKSPDESFKILKLSSSQARHVGIYKKNINDFGAEQMKRAKEIYIKPNNTTAFNHKNFQVMFTGLERKYEVGEEIELTIEFEHAGEFTTYLPVIANYN